MVLPSFGDARESGIYSHDAHADGGRFAGGDGTGIRTRFVASGANLSITIRVSPQSKSPASA